MLVSGIYPNPARDVVYPGIVLNDAQQLQLRLRDISSRAVLEDRFRLEAGNQTIKLLSPAFAVGTDSLDLTDEKGALQQRKLSIF